MNSHLKNFLASVGGFFDLSRHERVGAYAIMAVLAIAVAAMTLASHCTQGGGTVAVSRVPSVAQFDSATAAQPARFATPSRRSGKHRARKPRRAKAAKPRKAAPNRSLDPVPGF